MCACEVVLWTCARQRVSLRVCRDLSRIVESSGALPLTSNRLNFALQLVRAGQDGPSSRCRPQARASQLLDQTIRKRSEGDKGNASRCETVRPRSLVGDPSAGADQGLPPLDPALPFLPSPIRQGLLLGHCLRAGLHHGPPVLLSARM